MIVWHHSVLHAWIMQFWSLDMGVQDSSNTRQHCLVITNPSCTWLLVTNPASLGHKHWWPNNVTGASWAVCIVWQNALFDLYSGQSRSNGSPILLFPNSGFPPISLSWCHSIISYVCEERFVLNSDYVIKIDIK